MVKWLDRCLIASPIFYALCVDEKSFKKELKRMNVPKGERPDFLKSSHAHATTHFFKRSDKVVAIICIRKNSEFDINQIHALLLHEAVHLWQEIKIYIDENNPSKEFEAYSIQALAQNLFYAYKKMNKSKLKAASPIISNNNTVSENEA